MLASHKVSATKVGFSKTLLKYDRMSMMHIESLDKNKLKLETHVRIFHKFVAENAP